ncbi:MAG: hypothetical protein ACUVUH_08735 [bacterium]
MERPRAIVGNIKQKLKGRKRLIRNSRSDFGIRIQSSVNGVYVKNNKVCLSGRKDNKSTEDGCK